MIILKSSDLVKQTKEIIKNQISHTKPGLATVLVGEDPASKVYVNSKIKACDEVGFYSKHIKLEDSCTTEELISVVQKLNNDPNIHGILVQFPLPKHIDSDAVIYAIDPSKDVDCFHPTNIGKLFLGQSDFAPCTPTGIISLLESLPDFTLEGKNAVVIGRSNLVGKPINTLLTNKNCTSTLIHSKTKDISMYTKNADIIVVATGQPKMLKEDMVKDGVVIIDVGINRDPETNKLIGDVDFENVKDKCFAITPVPGGVGPMTVVSLLSNTLRLASKL